MSKSPDEARIASMGFLICSAVAFGVFQLGEIGTTVSRSIPSPLPAGYCVSGYFDPIPMRGFQVWREIYERFATRSPLPFIEFAIAFALLTAALLAVTSPFLFGTLARSRSLWITACALSLLTAAGIVGIPAIHSFTGAPSPFPWRNPGNLLPLFTFPILNLAGLLFIRMVRKPAR